MGMSLPQPSLHCVAGGQNKQPSGLEVEKPFGRNRRELESSGSAKTAISSEAVTISGPFVLAPEKTE